MNTKHIYFSAVLGISVAFSAVLMTGCHGVEKGTGQVLENAGSAIKFESSKLWIPKDEPGNEVAQGAGAEESEKPEDDKRDGAENPQKY